MTEMRPQHWPVVLYATALLTVGVVVLAFAVVLPGGVVAETPTNASASSPDSPQPGAELAGAVGSEEAKLDGQLQSRTYELRLQQADTRAEREAVLREIGTDLDTRLSALEQRQDQITRANLSAGKDAYLRERAIVESITLTRLTSSTSRLVGQSGLDRELQERYVRLTDRSATLRNESVGADDIGTDIDIPEINISTPTDRGSLSREIGVNDSILDRDTRTIRRNRTARDDG
jgi:hypothetical protein